MYCVLYEDAGCGRRPAFHFLVFIQGRKLTPTACPRLCRQRMLDVARNSLLSLLSLSLISLSWRGSNMRLVTDTCHSAPHYLHLTHYVLSHEVLKTDHHYPETRWTFLNFHCGFFRPGTGWLKQKSHVWVPCLSPFHSCPKERVHQSTFILLTG